MFAKNFRLGIQSGAISLSPPGGPQFLQIENHQICAPHVLESKLPVMPLESLETGSLVAAKGRKLQSRIPVFRFTRLRENDGEEIRGAHLEGAGTNECRIIGLSQD